MRNNKTHTNIDVYHSERSCSEDIQIRNEISQQLVRVADNPKYLCNLSKTMRPIILPLIKNLNFIYTSDYKRFMLFISQLIKNPSLPLFETDNYRTLYLLWKCILDFEEAFLEYTESFSIIIHEQFFWRIFLNKIQNINERSARICLFLLPHLVPSDLICKYKSGEYLHLIENCFEMKFDEKFESMRYKEMKKYISENCTTLLRWACLLEEKQQSMPGKDRDFRHFSDLIAWFKIIKITKYGKNSFSEQFHIALENKIGIESILYLGKKKIHQLMQFHRNNPELLNFEDFMTECQFEEETSDKNTEILASLLVKFRIPMVFLKYFFDLKPEELEWFKHVLQGQNLVTAPSLPIPMTKKGAHIFLDVHTKKMFNDSKRYRIQDAMLYAQVVANGCNEEVAEEILRTKIARYPEKFEFWRSVIEFFKKNDVPRQHIHPLSDYIYSRKYEEGDKGFCMKGRTKTSMLRDMEEWHAKMAMKHFHQRNKLVKWEACQMETFTCSNIDGDFIIKQLLSNEELFVEGQVLHHCVYSYTLNCAKGDSTIWSLLEKKKSGEEIRLLTIELRNRRIVQIRGKHNRLATIEEMKIIKCWARKERIGLL